MQSQTSIKSNKKQEGKEQQVQVKALDNQIQGNQLTMIKNEMIYKNDTPADKKQSLQDAVINQPNISASEKPRERKQAKNKSAIKKTKATDELKNTAANKKPINQDKENLQSINQSPLESKRITITQNIKQYQFVRDSLQKEQQKEEEAEETIQLSTKTIKTQISVTSRYNYKENLKAVFQHYCKMSYALRKNPTFEEIQEKAHVMTINKFMVFCKDFCLRERLSRQYLVDIFKSNASCCKQMNFPQFQLTLAEMSGQIFPDYSDQKQFNRMLAFLKMHTSTAFTNRMNEIGIKYRQRSLKSPQTVSKYEFKLTPNCGKSEEQIFREVREKKEERQVRKLEMIKYHKVNKTNKIDELYKNGAEHLSKNSKKLNKSALKISDLQNRNVYNPSIIISTLKGPKKYTQLYKKRHEQPAELYDHLGHKIKEIRDMKVSKIIKSAKQQVKFEKQNFETINTDRLKSYFSKNSEDADISELRIKSQIRTLGQQASRKTKSIFLSENRTVKRSNFIEKEINFDAIISKENDDILDQLLQAQQRLYYKKKNSQMLLE